MKKNKGFNPIEIDDLISKFLYPTEDNRNSLLDRINCGLKALPAKFNEDNPFLICESYSSSKVKNFESIPNFGRSSDEVLRAAIGFLQGQLRWHSPFTLHNITPSPMIDTVAISAITNLYNPNMIWDYVSAGTHNAEQQIIRQLGSLVGWGSDSGGCFTFGGKACLMYAIRIGINRCLEEVSKNGLCEKQSPVVLTSMHNHYIIENVCSFIGIGKNACIRVKTKEDETLDLFEFQESLRNILKQGRPIACVILSGGNTLHISIDPLKEAMQIVNDLCDEFELSYRPFIYVDAVVGWPWLFFKDYDFQNNPLQIKDKTLGKVHTAMRLISDASLADAIGIDFHKIGFCPYATSLFITKKPAELHSINNNSLDMNERQPFGHNFLQHYTIEHSRSAAPVLSAWVSLQSAGKRGFQAYLGQLTMVGDIFREYVPYYDFELLNPFSLGFASVFCPLLQSKNYTYQSLLNATSEEIESYNQYVYRLYSYLEGNEGSSDRMVLRFLKNYKQANCGSWPAVIVIYPMSLHITMEKAKEICFKIGEAKKNVDREFCGLKLQYEIPRSVHK